MSNQRHSPYRSHMVVVLLTATISLIVACGGEGATEVETQLVAGYTCGEASGEAIRFLALGDSYTIGEGVEPLERWPDQLMRLLCVEGMAVGELTILARTGWTTDELLAALNQADLQPHYDLVSVLIGVNNQYRGLSKEGYHNDLRTLFEQAVESAGGRRDRVIVLSIPDWSATPFAAISAGHGLRDRSQMRDEIEQFNAILREDAQLSGLHFVDVTPISREVVADEALLASDGLHPSGEMYALWAEVVAPIAQKALASR